jgi:activator of Hsp90 ATPase-like protein
MAVPPISRQVVVRASRDIAFELFTERIGSWWPLGDFGVFGSGATVAFNDGRIVERSESGETAIWGEVTRWDEPSALACTWHPGKSEEDASLVDVGFEEEGDLTLVTLVHSNWEVFSDPARAQEEYGEGWPVVLGCFVNLVAARPTGEPGGHEPT